MIQRAVIFTEYCFYPNVGGTDHLEGNQWTIDRVLGEGVVDFHNKRGSLLRVMFIGEMSTVKKANVLYTIEKECRLVYSCQKEAKYKPEFENNLKSRYGDKLVVK